jgi:tryptophanyl-tRNA synthetase
VEGNPLFIYHDTFNPDTEEVEELKERYRAGRVGDVEVKRRLAAALNETLAPIRSRRAELVSRPNNVIELLRDGTARAVEITRQTLDEVQEKMGLATHLLQQELVPATGKRRKSAGDPLPGGNGLPLGGDDLPDHLLYVP